MKIRIHKLAILETGVSVSALADAGFTYNPSTEMWEAIRTPNALALQLQVATLFLNQEKHR